MSLKHIADHIAAQGRGGDSTLVHMAPSEVKNLQGIARLHGGSLTINPKTGLPEADFLKAILPTLEGAALVAGSGGAIDPATAAMMVGGFNAVQSGSIMQGLSAGMGAYGGGNLSSGMTFAGEAPPPGELADLKEAALQTPAPVVTPQPTPVNLGSVTGADMNAMTNPEIAFEPPPSGAVSTPVTSNWGQLPMGQTYAGDLTSLNPYPTAGVGQTYGEFGDVVPSAGANNVVPSANAPGYSDVNYQNGADIGGAGSSAVNTGAPQSTLAKNLNVLKDNMTAKNMMYAFGPAVASELMQPRQVTGMPTPAKHGTTTAPTYTAGKNMTGDTGVDPYGQERRWLQPSYTPGVYYAEGGPVENEFDFQHDGQPIVRMAEGGIARLASGGMMGDALQKLVGQAKGMMGLYPDSSSTTAPAKDYAGYYQNRQAQPQANTYGISGYDHAPNIQSLNAGYRYDPSQVQAQNNRGYSKNKSYAEQLDMVSNAPAIARARALSQAQAPTQNYTGYYRQSMAPQSAANMQGISGYDQGPQTQSLGQGYRYDPAQIQATLASHAVAPTQQGPGTLGGSPMMQSASLAAAASPGARGLATGGGISTLGGYSDGGRLLKGPGDGMSDNIPAQIGAKQPARLADGEFVVPADVVSHLGNGSTDAGAKQLYKMMDKIRTARTGRKSQGKQINPNKFMPA